MAVTADLDSLRTLLGMTQTRDDAVLQMDLDAAIATIQPLVMEDDWLLDDVQLAVLMAASRLYSRRRSPEGVAGFGSDGLIVRVVTQDPDIYRLLEHHLDMLEAGLA